jgi:hypothetical protein
VEVSEAGANPALSRNCDAPYLGTSQVACSAPRNRPRLKGDLCGSAAGPLFILRE